ncbi:hypothetical protein FOZ62_029228, partial [Perkinsus olseni]
MTSVLARTRPAACRRGLLGSQAGPVRTFFNSKWVRRIERLTAPSRRPPPPVIPEKEVPPPVDPSVTPVNPVLGSKRPGICAFKIGCMGLWDEWGQKHAVTVCKVHNSHVMRQKTIARNGYEALQVGTGWRTLGLHERRRIGCCIRAGVEPKHHIEEFRVSSDCMLPVGHEFSVRHFVPGQRVFVSGWSRGKGWQGVVTRWRFAGQQVHKATGGMRMPGSISRGMSSSKVDKYKKQPGHMGPDPRVTNCTVFRIESTRNLIFLKGAVPGSAGHPIKIFDGRGITWYRNTYIKAPTPTFIPKPGLEYPVTVQMPATSEDPFLYPERPRYDPRNTLVFIVIMSYILKAVQDFVNANPVSCSSEKAHELLSQEGVNLGTIGNAVLQPGITADEANAVVRCLEILFRHEDLAKSA